MLVASDALVAGEVRMVRLESALGPCVQGLHEKREKVPHPGLQHVLGRHGISLCENTEARVVGVRLDESLS